MTQVIETGSFKPNTVYTLSINGATLTQITSPASGNWSVDVNFTGTNTVQLEEGPIATPFEIRPAGIEVALCQRYYQVMPIATAYAFDAEIIKSTGATGYALYWPGSTFGNLTTISQINGTMREQYLQITHVLNALRKRVFYAARTVQMASNPTHSYTSIMPVGVYTSASIQIGGDKDYWQYANTLASNAMGGPLYLTGYAADAEL